MNNLSGAEQKFLEHALSAKIRMGWVACTNRVYRKTTAQKLVQKGMLVPCVYQVCDGDGFALQPERERVGYELTELGENAAKEGIDE